MADKMRKTHTITCVVTSESEEKLRAAEDLVREQIKPGGVVTGLKRIYKLNDYFDSIIVLGDTVDAHSFQLVFHPRKDADRFWKDLVVMIAKSLRDSAGVSIAPSCSSP